MVALDHATGKKVWEHANGRRFENDRGDGPRSTPTVDGDRLYVLGGSGDLTCLEAATGRRIWSVNLVQKFGGVNPYWGYSESPLIVGDRILVNAGGNRASIVAVAKTDGQTLWQQHSDEAGYSSPMLLRTGSLSQVVFFTGSRVLAVDPRDGRSAVVVPEGRQRHREHRDADRPRHAHLRVVRLRHRRRVARRASRRQHRLGERGLLHPRHAQSPRDLGR